MRESKEVRNWDIVVATLKSYLRKSMSVPFLTEKAHSTKVSVFLAVSIHAAKFPDSSFVRGHLVLTLECDPPRIALVPFGVAVITKPNAYCYNVMLQVIIVPPPHPLHLRRWHVRLH